LHGGHVFAPMHRAAHRRLINRVCREPAMDCARARLRRPTIRPARNVGSGRHATRVQWRRRRSIARLTSSQCGFHFMGPGHLGRSYNPTSASLSRCTGCFARARVGRRVEGQTRGTIHRPDPTLNEVLGGRVSRPADRVRKTRRAARMRSGLRATSSDRWLRRRFQR
jgi:hypothetical protein